MIKKLLIILFISQLLLSCGFTPSLKMSDKDESSPNVYFEIKDNSYIVRQTLSTIVKNIDETEAKYVTKVNVSESQSAVNIQSNGTVDEYKIEILINFQIIDLENNDLIYKSQSRGFANYDVSSSEYTNSLVKKEALKAAITDAAQLMNIMVQSKINK